MKFFEEFELQKNCEINLRIKTFLGLAEMMFGLVNVSFSLPQWQAVKVTFFASCRKKVRVIGNLKQITGNKEMSKWMQRECN